MDLITNSIVKTNSVSLNSIFTMKCKIYTFLNPVSYLQSLDNKDIYLKFDGIFADGSILAAAIKLMYGQSIVRRSFDMTSIAPELFRFAENNNKSIYFVASQQKEVLSAISIFEKRYPKLIVVGYRNGYFNSEEEEIHEVQHIVQLNPDFIIIGMGAIVQERFLLTVKEHGYKGIGFTCGGFIHQTANNKIDYYPKLVNRTNLRFAYRMYKEKHTRKRYLQAAFLFPIRFILEKCFCNN